MGWVFGGGFVEVMGPGGQTRLRQAKMQERASRGEPTGLPVPRRGALSNFARKHFIL